MAVVVGVMLEAFKAAVRPVGARAVTLTLPVKPFSPVTVTVELPLDPAGRVRVEGDEAIEKSGPTTVTDTKVEWERKPLKPSISTV